MAIHLEDLLRLRPFAYHTSGRTNFEAIRRERALRSTAQLLGGTGNDHLLGNRRLRTIEVTLSSGRVSIRDQRPLRPGSIRWEGGCNLPRYLNELNARVFFWLGTARGPNKRGTEHRAQCAAEGGIFTLRIPLRSLLVANEGNPAFVTRCNSGSARHLRGKPVVRGLRTFRLLDEAGFPASQAIELSFRDRAALPFDIDFTQTGTWRRLWPVAELGSRLGDPRYTADKAC